MVELDEEVQLLVALYFKHHKPAPVRGSGSIQLAFQVAPPTRPPVFEPLLYCPETEAWYVRWPVGSTGWWTATKLLARGFTLPPHPLVAIIHANGEVEPYWQPPVEG